MKYFYKQIDLFENFIAFISIYLYLYHEKILFIIYIQCK